MPAAIFGIMAEFESPTALVAAARRAREKGYRKLDAYSPFPIEELNEALALHDNRLARLVLGGGVLGMLTGYGLQYWVAAINYPLNIGGRPLNSWPSFIPVTFELTVLFASLAAFFGLLGLNGLPQPYHPVFNVPGFAMASRNRFFLCIQAADPLFDRKETAVFLESLEAKEVSEVAN
jgi:hypothetical protein